MEKTIDLNSEVNKHIYSVQPYKDFIEMQRDKIKQLEEEIGMKKIMWGFKEKSTGKLSLVDGRPEVQDTRHIARDMKMPSETVVKIEVTFKEVA